MELKAVTNKSFVLGIDGMDPRLTKKYINEGRMPNTERLIARGAARKDLTMLGGMPTVTPPMWTTLATGAYPCTHGITQFSRIVWDNIITCGYNMDSRNCKAEPLWNVSAENGIKTLVFHWPGSSWPPTSDNANLHVVDGTQPAAVNMGVAQVESEFILVASTKTDAVTYRKKAATDANVPCVITDLQLDEDAYDLTEAALGANGYVNIVLTPEEGQGSLTAQPYDVVLSPIKDAKDWNNVPEDAKEFVLLFAQGRVRRVGLILKNEEGVYDRIAIYRSKKEAMPIRVIKNGEFANEVIDESLNKDDKKIVVNRNMRVLEIKPDGSYIKIWISAAMDIAKDDVWHPKRLYKMVTEHVGYPAPECMTGAADEKLIVDCMIANWERLAKWESEAIHYLIEQEHYGMVFSHFHSIDACGHMIVKYLKERKDSRLSERAYQEYMALVYEQADRYIGTYLHMLDEGWTIYLVSDHAQVSPEYDVPMINDSGVSVRVMEELGFTALKKDENGNDLHEIDWANTKAIALMTAIIINDTERFPEHGIVAPEDKYEVEEEIMTALYGYRDKKTQKRIISLALRNKDAYILGMGGPECGDIVFFNAEGYTYDHADSISTTFGYANTSVSPIFIAAGKGIKEGCITERIIREVDLIPTMAVLAGLRMPAQCEGAPIYQIMDM